MIRKAAARDAHIIADILADTKSPWSELSVTESIENKAHTVLVYGTDVKGVLIFSEVFGEYEILNFAVKRDRRGKGIGEKLLTELINRANCIYLDVRKSNYPAISLYKKHNFKVMGERVNFYNNPKEDAILMVLKK